MKKYIFVVEMDKKDKERNGRRSIKMLTGRTLIGHESAKNQQLEDHYFGAISTRVMAFMKDLECECLKLGIPVKTRHNEVAPNQFELAPIFEKTNLANDHNQLLMAVMKKIARRHCFRLLLQGIGLNSGLSVLPSIALKP